MDGPERLRLYGKGVGWTGGLALEGGIGMKSREGELREYNRAPDALNGRPRAPGGREGKGKRGGVESQRVGRSDNSGPEDKWRVINENN